MSDGKINILYIDNRISGVLSKFLREKCQDPDSEYSYKEFQFTNEMTIDVFFQEEIVKNSDIILLDNLLYENQTVVIKERGDNLIPLFQFYYPFKKVVIITQRDRAISDSDIQYFSKRGKFEKGKESDKKDSINKYFEYYETELWQNIILKLGNAIKSERASIRAFSKLDGNMIDEVSKERVFQSYNGDISYRNLTKEDVDCLVEKISTLIKKVSK